MRMIIALAIGAAFVTVSACASGSGGQRTTTGTASSAAAIGSAPPSATQAPTNSLTPGEQAYLKVAVPMLLESDADATSTGKLICQAFQVSESYPQVGQAASRLKLSTGDLKKLTRVSVAAFCPSERSALETSIAASQIHKFGTSVSTGDGKITIYSLQYPYPPSGEAADIKDPGDDFAVADIKFCPLSSDADYSNFQLSATDSRTFTFWNVQIGAEEPNLTDSLGDASPGACVRGYLTFEVTHGEKLRHIRYVDLNGNAATWMA